MRPSSLSVIPPPMFVDCSVHILSVELALDGRLHSASFMANRGDLTQVVCDFTMKFFRFFL